MKNLFSKRKSDTMSQSNILTNGIKKSYEQLKHRWANWMANCTKNFSRRRWILLLLFFIISTGSISIYVMINSFRERETSLIVITPIRKSNQILETGEANIGTKRPAGKDYNHVKEIREYMDSLIKSPSGKIVYDSITSHRPGLMDSLSMIENYFQQLK